MADSSKPDIWMPLYVADYQADTAYLTTEQHGAYLLMLMAYWRNGPIPDNNQIIAAITRQTPDAWSNTRASLEAFFSVADGFWVHKRVEKEYDRAKKNRDSAHNRAVKAAAARWGRQADPKHEEMLGALHMDMHKQCPSPSPIPSQSKADQKLSPSDLSAGKPTDGPKTDDQSQKRQASEAIPYQAVLDAYNANRGMFPEALKLTESRKRLIRARWLGDTTSPKERQLTNRVDYWVRYFAHCSKDVEFFRRAAAGENKGDHAGWRPSFDFLMREKTWVDVLEGTKA